MRRVFVSHTTADDSFVAEMESFLCAAGFDDVFNDVHAIKPDEQFWPGIEQGITDCDAFIVVITAASNDSEWVKREVALARHLGKRVIPVWREDCPLPSDFTDRDVIDFRPRARKERRFDIGRIVKYAPAELIGREAEIALLTESWQKTLRLEKGRPRVLTFVALGGEGKTSLVAKWLAEMAGQDWPGCDAAFAWSFYSQGTREQQAASSDLFLKEALAFFGDEAMAASPVGAYEKGRRLSQLVGKRRALLILDGLEPLQYAPTSPMPGQLKDQGIAALLTGLAATSHGLCVVTTRCSLPDLKVFWQSTAPEVKLLRLSRDAGVHLLKTLGVRGTPEEFAALVEDVKGHALTLNLLGGFLSRAFHGDIRLRDRVKFVKADEKMAGGHAFRTMAAYEQWLLSGGEEGRREVGVLRLMGLFDRPADIGSLEALRREPLPGLTEELAGLPEEDWEFCLSGLETAKLITANRDVANALISLDAHPLLREYFARQLREQQPDAWRAAHRKLYEHLCATAPECTKVYEKRPGRLMRYRVGDLPTLQDLQPLYEAVVHGCEAGLHQHACVEVLIKRINLGQEHYATKILAAFGAELTATTNFFDQPWKTINREVSPKSRDWLFHAAGFFLTALGRLGEAIEPMRLSLVANKNSEKWANAATAADNLCDVESTLGQLTDALQYGRQAVDFADRGSDSDTRIGARAELGRVLHQCGRLEEGERWFKEAETMNDRPHLLPNYKLLSSTSGFVYCDLILAPVEREAWRAALGIRTVSSKNVRTNALRHAESRGKQTLEWGRRSGYSALSVGLDELTLRRVALYKCIKRHKPLANSLDESVAQLRVAGFLTYLPLGLFTRSWLRFLTGACTGPDSAQSDLDQAWDIASRGPMRLHMADIHLYRARLFFREKEYPWESPAADLAAAEKLINDCGYHRRDQELADAKRAILGEH